MGLPSIEIIFKSVGITAIQRGERGIVALILKDTVPATNPLVMDSPDDIPTNLTPDNIAEINRAWIGYVNPPKRVIAYVIAADAPEYTTAEIYLETIKWDYVAVPAIASGETTAFATWIKSCRDDKGLKVKAVLPDTVTDHEGIINFATDGIIVGTTTYNAAQYCSRIAGMLAGTPLYMSATYAPLAEVDDVVPHNTKAQFDTLIDAGKLVLINDGEKVKIARAVNSLTTTTEDKGTDFQKIKIVDILDQVYDDITTTANDSYIGKYANNYDNKCLLITAINAYLASLVSSQLLDSNETNAVNIDTAANILYLQGEGTDTSTMTAKQIKEANTGSEVLLTGNITPCDAMEDITLNLYM
jgi:hypothetical protein